MIRKLWTEIYPGSQFTHSYFPLLLDFAFEITKCEVWTSLSLLNTSSESKLSNWNKFWNVYFIFFNFESLNTLLLNFQYIGIGLLLEFLIMHVKLIVFFLKKSVTEFQLVVRKQCNVPLVNKCLVLSRW